MLTFISAILVFGLLIGIHEAGHLIAAKATGVTVFEFAIGMGPRLFSFRAGGTVYSLRILPIGGYCKMDGEDEKSDNPGAFCNKAAWKRLIVVVAGAVMNIILGFLIYVVLNAGFASDFRVNTVDNVLPGSPAGQVGLMAGDEVVKVNGKNVYIPADVNFEIFSSEKTDVDITVERDGETFDFTVAPRMYIHPYTDEMGNVSGGYFADDTTSGEIIEKYGSRIIGYELESAPKTVGNVLKTSFFNCRYTVRIVAYSLKMLVTGNVGLNDISGPVGMVDQIGTSAASGISSLLALTALITINLGIFNLLPLPALDGGRVLFLLIEMIRRKPVPPEREGIVHFVGLAVLMILMLIVTANDIFKLIT